MRVTRRRFVLSAAAVPLSGVCRGANGIIGAAVVRPPAVGQSWVYAKHDLFTRKKITEETNYISASATRVDLQVHADPAAELEAVEPSWDADWWRKRLGNYTGAPPSEVHQPWGMIWIDPHWEELQVYENPLPLWPLQLHPGWSITVYTPYETPQNPDEPLPWQLTMHAHGWESLAVPAGRFTALRYHNLINFRFTSVSERVSAQREEKIWFAPEIGRWVARESWGTFYQDVGERFRESSFRWELLSWT